MQPLDCVVPSHAQNIPYLSYKNRLLGTHLFLLTACRLEYEENIKYCLLPVKPT